MRAFAVVALGLLALSSPADAQGRPRSDSLPRDLVTALLGGSIGGPAIDVQSGLADSVLPADMFRDAQVLGYGDFRGTVMTVAYFPYAPQPTVDTIRARLVASGWKAPPRDTVRGFVQSYGNMYSQAVCARGSIVMPTVRIRSLNRTLAVISRQVSPEMAAEICGDSTRSMVRERMRFNAAANTPLPALEPPPGMESRGGGSTGVASDDRAMEMSTSLMGSVPIEDMMIHYSRLFTDARWRKLEEVRSSSMAIMAFETNANGQRWHCAFSISMPSPNAADVRLSLRRY